MKKTNIYLFFFAILFFNNTILAQSIELIRANEQVNHFADRLDILNGRNTNFFFNTRPLSARSLTQWAEQLDSTRPAYLSPKDIQDLQYIIVDNNEYAKSPPPQYRPYKLLKNKYLSAFYPNRADAFAFNSEPLKFRIAPLLNVQLARNSENDITFTNERGLELSGIIDNKVSFYTNLILNAAQFPQYVHDKLQIHNSLLGYGLLKSYVDNSIGFVKRGLELTTAQAHIGFKATKHIDITFGHGRNFIGDGYRSLLLSDLVANHLYLKINTKIGKINYQNIFAELQGDIDTSNQNAAVPVLSKKYVATHHFSYNIRPNFSIGLFETVVFTRNNTMELNYFNPIIFYRALEYNLNSADNVMLGANFKYNFLRKFSLYGQFILDELLIKELFIERRGWWANKYGLQLGAKYINIANIDHLDGQIEYNMVRPYTYSHYNNRGSYTNYSQPLAHPLGANFSEWIVKLRYQPTPRWIFDARLIASQTGEDPNGLNYGADPYKPNKSYVNEFGNTIGQGIKTDILLTNFTASYQFAHNMFVDANIFYRKKTSEDATRNQNSFYIGGGIRMNLNQIRMDF